MFLLMLLLFLFHDNKIVDRYFKHKLTPCHTRLFWFSRRSQKRGHTLIMRQAMKQWKVSLDLFLDTSFEFIIICLFSKEFVDCLKSIWSYRTQCLPRSLTISTSCLSTWIPCLTSRAWCFKEPPIHMLRIQEIGSKRRFTVSWDNRFHKFFAFIHRHQHIFL